MRDRRRLQHPDAYRLAAYLGARFGADRILVISRQALLGSGASISAPKVGPDLDRTAELLATLQWILVGDARGTEPRLADEEIQRSVVVCTSVLERLSDPEALLTMLSRFASLALATIITTAERDVVEAAHELTRQPARWNATEFRDALEGHRIAPAFVGLIANDDDDLRKQTIVAVADRCPVSAGRSAPEDFRPLALMQTYNDIDIAPQTINELLDDGFETVVRDNWSTDGTFEALSLIERARPGLSLSRFPEQGPSRYHEYLGLLRWKEEEAARHPGRWIASVDSDEIRRSPWPDVSFRGGLYICERMGFNAADLTVLNFRPVRDGFSRGDNPESTLPHFEFGLLSAYFQQIKTWRQGGERIDLTDLGGHEARFAGRRIFPYKFLLKHYPLRTPAQARRKVFAERLPRYAPETRSRGWQVQYDSCHADDAFLWEPAGLIEFDDSRTRREYLTELISGIGIVRATGPDESTPKG